MNHLEQSTASQQNYSFVRIQQAISTVALLILGYYAISFFNAWPSTIKRTLYEVTIYLIPPSFVYALQYIMMRLGRISENEALFRRQDFRDVRRKEEALHHLLGRTPIPSVLSRARTLSGYNKFSPKSDEVGPPGLGNWDNSCYQNSVLQGLASLPAFQAYIHRSSLLCQKAQVLGGTTHALTRFVDQLADSSCQRTTIWTPGVLKSMDSWQQQDAQEYFSRVSDAVEKEALQCLKTLQKRSIPGLNCLRGGFSSRKESFTIDQSISRKQLQDIVHNPMDGMQAQSLRCQTCQYSEGISFTQFNCLTLNLGLGGESDIRDLLDAYTEAELIEGVECDECTRRLQSNANGEAATELNNEIFTKDQKAKKKSVLRTKAKQITLGRLPKDLVIHINRSIFDDFGNQRKNTSFVHVPERLEILGEWCAPIDAEENSVQTVYELKCMVTHQGRHDNGHYVAYGKRDKDWYCFNDEIVTAMKVEDVLSRGTAFMLFYEAIDRAEIMSSDLMDFEDAECMHTANNSSVATSGSESEPFEEPVTQPTKLNLPAMRTASGTLTYTESANSNMIGVIPAV